MAPVELRKGVTVPEQPASKTVEPGVTGTLSEDDSVKPAQGFDPGKPVPPRMKLTDQPVKRIAPFPEHVCIESREVPFRGLARNQARIAFPIGTKAAVWFGATLPGRWTAKLLGA